MFSPYASSGGRCIWGKLPAKKIKTPEEGEEAEQPSFFDKKKKNDGSGAAYKQSEGGSEAGSSPKGELPARGGEQELPPP